MTSRLKALPGSIDLFVSGREKLDFGGDQEYKGPISLIWGLCLRLTLRSRSKSTGFRARPTMFVL
jgi:hypothetical protein